jgi:hypothetical protein
MVRVFYRLAFFITCEAQIIIMPEKIIEDLIIV